MKKSLLFSAVIAFISIETSKAQVVYFPDMNFKLALIQNHNIDTNFDWEIQFSEAAAYSDSIFLGYHNITDATGIEAFTSISRLTIIYNYNLTNLNVSANSNLTYLNCRGNGITSLNISGTTALDSLYCDNNLITSLDASAHPNLTFLNCYANDIASLNLSGTTALKSIHCGSNELGSLDVSGSIDLTFLACFDNLLTSLDVSANTALTHLNCSYNIFDSLNVSSNTALTMLEAGSTYLKSLDVSANTALTSLNCTHSSQLTSLNVKNGNNINFNLFEANYNPNLSCIQVDDAGWSQINWPAPTSIDSSAYFNEICSVGLNNLTINDKVVSYPNPTTGSIFLSNNFNATITDLYGIVVSTKENTKQLDLSSYPTGMYFISLTDNKGQMIYRSKVMKE